MDPNRPPEAAYQHWMDDAANMGLMLFRMRNDSKREGIVARQQSSGTPPGTPPPVMSPTGRQGTSPVPSGPAFSPQRQQRRHNTSPIPVPHPHSQAPHAHHVGSPPPLSAFQPFQHPHQNVTPRTGLALQTPTVATASSGRTGAGSTASSTHDQDPDIPSTLYREPHRQSSRRSQQSLD